MRPRTTLTIRINPKIKKEFLAIIKEKGLNTCHIAEALFAAWIEGTKVTSRAVGLRPGLILTINQKFENVVAGSSSGNVGGSRIRRLKRGSRDGTSLTPISTGEKKRLYRPDDNCYSKKAGGMWEHRRMDSPSDINKLGHHISCECLDCSGRR